MGKVSQSSEAPKVEHVSDCGRTHRFAEYLALLYAKAEGFSEAEMSRDICGVDPLAEPERARKIVKARLKRAQWLADNPQRLLAETQPFARRNSQRNKVR